MVTLHYSIQYTVSEKYDTHTHYLLIIQTIKSHTSLEIQSLVMRQQTTYSHTSLEIWSLVMRQQTTCKLTASKLAPRD